MKRFLGTLVMLLFIFFTCNLPLSWAGPTAEAIGLEWEAYEDQDSIEGFYIYWIPRIETTECRLHTTYHDGARFQLKDPTATKADFVVFLPKGLKELCFAITVYDEEDRESGYATRHADKDDWGWTGAFVPEGLFTH